MPDRYKSMLLFGPPGVGKGTQGKLLGRIPGFLHLATGDIFRALDKESELGRQFLHYSSRGELVPDDLTIQVWRQHVRDLIDSGRYNPENDLLILDGMPRSVKQAKIIGEHIDVLKVIHLVAADINDMVERMKRRARKEGRHDDADEKVIRRRFEVYEQETAPVLAQYPKGLIVEIDAVGTPVEVLLNILKVVAPLYNERFGNPLAETRPAGV
jgi:adenylate kinase